MVTSNSNQKKVAARFVLTRRGAEHFFRISMVRPCRRWRQKMGGPSWLPGEFGRLHVPGASVGEFCWSNKTSAGRLAPLLDHDAGGTADGSVPGLGVLAALLARLYPARAEVRHDNQPAAHARLTHRYSPPRPASRRTGPSRCWCRWTAPGRAEPTSWRALSPSVSAGQIGRRNHPKLARQPPTTSARTPSRARQAPDGYTILFNTIERAHNEPRSASPPCPFNSMKDFFPD